MEIILKEEVPKLGSIGDVVNVKAGYARNYLIPRGLAVVADRRNLRVLEHQKRLAMDKRDREIRRSEGMAEKLRSVSLTIPARAGEEGRLFGSVTNQDIERALAEQDFSIDRRRIRLEQPIKAIGEYSVVVELPLGVEAEIKLSVVAEDPASTA